MLNNDQAALEILSANPNAGGPGQLAFALSVAASAAGRSVLLQLPDGRMLNPGLHVFVVTETPAQFLNSTSRIIAPLTYLQAQRHQQMAQMDLVAHHKAVTDLESERQQFEEADLLPDPEHTGYFESKRLELQHVTSPMVFMQSPAPGRLTLAVERSADNSVLGLFDDLSLEALLNSAKTPRGALDFELLAKSFRQQTFDGAFLEKVHRAAIISPMVSAVAVATPGTINRLMLARQPVVAAFTDCCLLLSDEGATAAATELASAPAHPIFWQQVVTRLLDGRDSESRILRLSREAAKALASFERDILDEARKIAADQARFLDQAPTQVAKCALDLHLGGDGEHDEIGLKDVKQAIALVQISVKQRLALLQQAAERDTSAFRERVLGTLRRAKAPLSARDVSRHIYSSKIGEVLPVLISLVKEGAAQERDGQYSVGTPIDLQVVAS